MDEVGETDEGCGGCGKVVAAAAAVVVVVFSSESDESMSRTSACDIAGTLSYYTVVSSATITVLKCKRIRKGSQHSRSNQFHQG